MLAGAFVLKDPACWTLSLAAPFIPTWPPVACARGVAALSVPYAALQMVAALTVLRATSP